ncbi:hypothetical protein BGZ52_012183, partial [Haplosporangium bisporale]
FWERVSNQEGGAVLEPKGCRDAAVKLEALLESYERAQDDIIRLDVLHTTVKLAARTLQLLTEAGGSMALQELKERVGLEAEARGETDSLGVQAV